MSSARDRARRREIGSEVSYRHLLVETRVDAASAAALSKASTCRRDSILSLHDIHVCTLSAHTFYTQLLNNGAGASSDNK
mmetsp:Transcript_26045/g.57900  ORF Transcript_26045/g.57900 Transcript_26045/m.57900 type:complete len:80 (+) Transcript_26045:66-305(+)